MRNKEKDYGIDAEVEIFSQEGQATGLVFWVQLKATEGRNEPLSKKVSLKIDTVKYYQTLGLPVLIVRYSEASDRFYCKWAHEIDLFYAKKGGKTIQIAFQDQDVWDGDSADCIVKELQKIRAIHKGRISFPIPCSFEIKGGSINGIPRGVLLSEIRVALSGFTQMLIYQADPEKADFHVSLSKDELFVKLASVTGCIFHQIKKRRLKTFSQGIVNDVMLGLAACLGNVGQMEMAGKIFLINALGKGFWGRPEFAQRYFPGLLKTALCNEAIDRLCVEIGKGENTALETIAAMVILFITDEGDVEKVEKIQNLLEKCLEASIARKDATQIGISHYNLGNHFRCREMFKKSLRHYFMARRFEPKYRNQPYYYQEIGSALYFLKKFRSCARIYHQALSMGAPKKVQALYADALMFGGKYKLAQETFQEYLSTEKGVAEWHLKNYILKILVKSTGIKLQERQVMKAIEKVDLSKSDKPSFVRSLKTAIKLDNLCGHAWFNLGIVQSKANEVEDAAFSFILCALTQPDDVEAWVNATQCCLNNVIPVQILLLVLHTAYFFNHDSYLSVLHKKLSTRLNKKDFENFSNFIDEFLPKMRDERIKPKFRLLHEDGFFKDVFENEEA